MNVLGRLVAPRTALALACLLAAGGCKKKPEEAAATEGMSELVSAYTAGMISRGSVIRVQLSRDVATPEQVGQAIEPSPFSLDPSIEGVTVWAAPNELQLRPSDLLPAGQAYTGSVDLEKVVPGGGRLQLAFEVLRPSFELSVTGIEAESDAAVDRQVVRGEVITADSAVSADVEQTLTAKHGKDALTVAWTHDGRRHGFTISGVKRGAQPSEVLIEVDGKAIGVDRKDSRTVAVPAAGAFEALGARAVTDAESYLELRFSDPVDAAQQLEGLITVSDHGELRFTVDGSVVRVYSSQTWSQSEVVTVHPGVRNTRKKKTAAAATLAVAFPAVLPAVRFAGKGVIVPTADNLTVPIETSNLRGLVVQAMRVHDSNLPQFLQVNRLDGNDELHRVGRVVWRHIVPLPFSPAQQGRWVRHGLDLAPLVKENPHGLYRLEIGFTSDMISYDCGGAAPPPVVAEALPIDSGRQDVQSSYWDQAGEGADGYDYWQLYENRNNPCHPGYFRDSGDHSIRVSRNVLVSNVGLIAKRGGDNSLVVFATDLLTTEPLSGMSVKALDYQRQVLGETRTDGEGMASLALARAPFIVIAERGDQAGILRLQEGEALSVGHFDVGGAQVAGALKGYLYGERGVWRPGDPIHLTFILMDTADGASRLPADHPVKLELLNSRGQLVDTQTRRGGVGGFYAFTTRTEPDAPTGDYLAKVKIGGAAFEKVLKIETVTPNRLKIDLGFDSELLTGPKATVQGTLSAAWLHGAPAKSLEASIDVAFRAVPTRFSRYGTYVFDDPTREYSGDNSQLFSGSLDETGKTAVTGVLEAGGEPPGMLEAAFTTRVYEPGGAFSIDRHAIPFSPYKRYLGIQTPKGDEARGMLLTDIKHPIEVVAVDASGNLVDGAEGEVEMRLYKLQWRWWWEKGQESLAEYAGSTGHTALQSKTVKLKKGAATWELEVKYPDWGRYLITARDTKGGHRSGKIVYIDWPGWAGRAQKDSPGGATVLSLSSDKAEVEVGKTVAINIPTAAKGRALVSLESGSRVVQAGWVEPQGDKAGDTTRYTFTATAAMAPNVYAHVTMVQPHQNAANDLPMRLYGVIPIKVVDPQSRLSPVLEAPEVFAPGAAAKIAVKEANGKAMTYTVALVDEGLLGLTRFATPDPWDHFYQRDALGVKTWDVYDDVAGAFGGRLESLLAIGGGEEGEGGDAAKSKANRFPPLVKFAGPYTLAAGARNEHSIQLPEYVGAVRVMIVAGTQRAFGKTDKSVFVRKPLMLLATLPRVLGPQESIDVPVSVFALDAKVKDVKVTIKAEGPLNLLGATSKKLEFPSLGDKTIAFPLTVGDKLGVGKVTVTAEGGGERASHTIEIDVRHPGKPQTTVLARSLAPNETWNEDLTLPGAVGTNTARLELSRVPPLDLGRRLDELVGYPHGCVEQTTSKAFPQVYLSKLLELEAPRKAAIDNNVKAAIDKLATFQNSGGGFSYWPGSETAHGWSTTYAGHFLVEAEKAGFRVPPGMLTQWKKYEREAAGAWSRGGAPGEAPSDLEQAYRLYALALASDPQLPAMNRLRQGTLSPQAAWRLAAAYQLAGQPEAATAVSKGATVQLASYRELSHTFGSELRDKAMVLEALVAMNLEKDLLPLVQEISDALTRETYLSTQETAFALVAMSRFITSRPPGGKLDATYSWAKGKESKVQSDRVLAAASLDASGKRAGHLTLKNQGSGTLFARLVASGLPPVGEDTSSENGLSVQVAYVGQGDAAVDPAVVEQGTDLVARVTVRNTSNRGRLEHVALSHLFPSGWEIVHDRASDVTYQDIRDDRVYTYIDLPAGGEKVIEVRVNAAYVGKYYLPPVDAEAMYDGTVNGREAGRWVEVVRPGVAG